MKILEKIALMQSNMLNNTSATIVFFGDSVTQGCFEAGVCESESTYVAKFGKTLSVFYPSVRFNIVNSGVGGNNTTDGLARFDRDVAVFLPDLVVVGFALNDACGGEAYLDKYEKNLTEICEKVNELHAECVVLTPNMMCTKATDRVADGMKNLIERFAEIQNNGLLDRIVETEKNVAAKCGAKICDVYSCWKQMSANAVDTTALLANGLNHPMREMHDLIAYKLIETFFSD